MTRDLIPMTPRERYELLTMKKNVLPFLPPEVPAKEGGYSPDQAKAWAEEREHKQQERFEQQAAQQQPDLRRPVGALPGGPQRGSRVQRRREEREPREIRRVG